MWDAVLGLGVPKQNVQAFASLYAEQTGRVCADKETRSPKIERGTKQGDPMRPQLFSAILEAVVRKPIEKWEKKKAGLRMNTVQPRSLLTICASWATSYFVRPRYPNLRRCLRT